MDIKIGSVIHYKFLFSNEESKVGLVYKIVKDNNFAYMLYILTNNEKDIVPYSILDYTIIE